MDFDRFLRVYKFTVHFIVTCCRPLKATVELRQPVFAHFDILHRRVEGQAIWVTKWNLASGIKFVANQKAVWYSKSKGMDGHKYILKVEIVVVEILSPLILWRHQISVFLRVSVNDMKILTNIVVFFVVVVFPWPSILNPLVWVYVSLRKANHAHLFQQLNKLSFTYLFTTNQLRPSPEEYSTYSSP
jgi:hypothetical protein